MPTTYGAHGVVSTRNLERGEQHASEVKEPLTANFGTDPNTKTKEMYHENDLIHVILLILGLLSKEELTANIRALHQILHPRKAITRK